MSGAEVLAVIGGIDAIIGVTKAIVEVYTTVKSLNGVPEAFSVVGMRLPLVQDIMESAKRHVQAEKDEAVCRAIKPIVVQSQTNIKTLQDIFESVKPADGAWKAERYYKAVKAKGKGSKVEVLMSNIFKDVQLLNSQRGMKTVVPQDKQNDILAAIKDLKEAPPSVPDSEFHESSITMSQTGSGIQQYLAAGNAYSTGGGKMFNATHMVFGKED